MKEAAKWFKNILDTSSICVKVLQEKYINNWHFLQSDAPQTHFCAQKQFSPQLGSSSQPPSSYSHFRSIKMGMKMLLAFALVQVSLTFLEGAAVRSYGKYIELPYEVLNKTDEFEVRRYPSFRYAEARETGKFGLNQILIREGYFLQNNQMFVFYGRVRIRFENIRHK